MSDMNLLVIDGEVSRPTSFSFDDLSKLDPARLVIDISRFVPKRAGDAATLAGLLESVGVKPEARYLTLHSSSDNFHASIPLDAVRDKGLVLFRANGAPLPASAGGPFRFFIPDHAACHVAEIDECANVKFVDRIELSRERGFDNRPTEDAEHEALHARQANS